MKLPATCLQFSENSYFTSHPPLVTNSEICKKCKNARKVNCIKNYVAFSVLWFVLAVRFHVRITDLFIHKRNGWPSKLFSHSLKPGNSVNICVWVSALVIKMIINTILAYCSKCLMLINYKEIDGKHHIYFKNKSTNSVGYDDQGHSWYDQRKDLRLKSTCKWLNIRQTSVPIM